MRSEISPDDTDTRREKDKQLPRLDRQEAKASSVSRESVPAPCRL